MREYPLQCRCPWCDAYMFPEFKASFRPDHLRPDLFPVLVDAICSACDKSVGQNWAMIPLHYSWTWTDTELAGHQITTSTNPDGSVDRVLVFVGDGSNPEIVHVLERLLPPSTAAPPEDQCSHDT